MNTVQEYRNPLLIAAVGVVVAILLYALVYSPQSSKLSTLQTQETTLQGQELSLQNQLTALQTEKQKLSANCADLVKISTQIPSVQSPGDLAAEQSSFYDQLTALVGLSGTAIPSFSWTGSTSTATSSASATPASGTAPASGVVPVPVSMTITGTYAQMSSFVGGLDSFPRLFVIQTFGLAVSSSAGGASTTPVSGGGAAASGNEAAPALWTGGVPTPGTNGTYTLTVTGSIYYTTTADALAACDAAASAK
ncbi:MAG: type 4a pilus biogenesis protein PilO [Acidimicrobiales bacterium]